jgi:hypothetical protein
VRYPNTPQVALTVAEEYFTLPTPKDPSRPSYVTNLTFEERQNTAHFLNQTVAMAKNIVETPDSEVEKTLEEAREELRQKQSAVAKSLAGFLAKIKRNTFILQKIATPGIVEGETVVERVRSCFDCTEASSLMVL